MTANEMDGHAGYTRRNVTSDEHRIFFVLVFECFVSNILDS